LPAKKTTAQRRIFVLDTNVLMHDPTAIFRFEEHDIFIPMTVLEELDAGKKGMSEAARNVRQVSRFLDELMASASKQQIDRGLELPTAKGLIGGKKPPRGRLFFQTRLLASGLPDNLPGHGADIVGVSPDTLASHEKFKAKFEFPFELLADVEKKACTLFDVIKEKSMYGRKYLGVERSTFLIDARGVLRREWRKVKVAGHAAEVLAAVRET
jgi:hypothetical protein